MYDGEEQACASVILWWSGKWRRLDVSSGRVLLLQALDSAAAAVADVRVSLPVCDELQAD